MRLTALVVSMAAMTARADNPISLSGDKTKVTVTFESSTNRGEQVYRTYCHHCHGEKGDGTGHIGRGLMLKPVDLTAPELGPRMTVDAIKLIVREGSGKPGAAMIPWKLVLPDEVIKDVAVYTAALAAEGRAKRLKAEPPATAKTKP